jgi:hypothetical protein
MNRCFAPSLFDLTLLLSSPQHDSVKKSASMPIKAVARPASESHAALPASPASDVVCSVKKFCASGRDIARSRVPHAAKWGRHFLVHFVLKLFWNAFFAACGTSVHFHMVTET